MRAAVSNKFRVVLHVSRSDAAFLRGRPVPSPLSCQRQICGLTSRRSLDASQQLTNDQTVVKGNPPGLLSSLLRRGTSLFKLGSVRQQKNLFIQTQTTPNPLSLMFYPGKPVMDVGSADFPNSRAGMSSPLAKALFQIDGIIRVFFGSDFVTVTKAEDFSWDLLKPEVFAAIMDFYTSNQPLFYDSKVAAPSDTAIKEDDTETVAMIKELIETRIRPAVQDDGGDIEYQGFDVETGVVKLKLQGACSGCPSSSVTLKSGIQNMLMHYVPDVKGVEEVRDPNSSEEEVGASQA